MKRKYDEQEEEEEYEDLPNLVLDAEAIGKLLESAPEVDVLDIVGLKRLLVSFERSLTKNSQMRIKYPGQPAKIVDSEVDLDEEIKKLHALATAPHLFRDFIDLKAHESVMSLLIHENTDITCDAIELIKELTDSENSDEGDEAVKLLVDTMMANQILELLVSNLNRLKESDADEKLVAVHPVGDETPHGHAGEVHCEIHAVGVVAVGVPAERHVAVEDLMTQVDQDRVHSDEAEGCAAPDGEDVDQ